MSILNAVVCDRVRERMLLPHRIHIDIDTNPLRQYKRVVAQRIAIRKRADNFFFFFLSHLLSSLPSQSTFIYFCTICYKIVQNTKVYWLYGSFVSVCVCVSTSARSSCFSPLLTHSLAHTYCVCMDMVKLPRFICRSIVSHVIDVNTQ